MDKYLRIVKASANVLDQGWHARGLTGCTGLLVQNVVVVGKPVSVMGSKILI